MSLKAYYNEHDKSAAAWLRELIKEGVITDGTVDERSIEDVVPAELAEFDRCHFFAGIGVWDHALNQAGWGDRPVWTGSCPCQPFSAAGKGDGFADERHLWPAWFHLIEQCRPRTIFGEQVSSKDTMPWIDLVQSDLEGALYTVGAADLCSPSVGAPHIRQRLYFVAHAASDGHSRRYERGGRSDAGSEQGRLLESEGDRTTSELAIPVSLGRRGRRDGNTPGDGGEVQVEGRGSSDGLGDAGGKRLEGSEQRTARNGNWDGSDAHGSVGESSSSSFGVGQADAESTKLPRVVTEKGRFVRRGPTNGFWADAEWIWCRDEKYRAIEPGTFPLAHGAAGRVGRLRGYGNAIVAPLATEWIKAFLDWQENI